jgi:RHS repeat-associated protein
MQPGAVLKRVDYDSFGNILADSNPSFTVSFGFAGGLHDPATGLVRFGFRDYDPDVGRWTAKDPILFAGSDTDLFGYCLNDPINFVDPEGLRDIFYGVEGDLVGVTGVEGGFGIVIDTDNLGESGLYGTIGPAVGANVGVSHGGGIVNEVEGWSYSIDANVGVVSPVIVADNSGFNGVAFGKGPGLGMSVSATYTGTYSLIDMYEDMGALWKKIKGAFGEDNPC